ncbi:hypothetical protein FDX19_15505 [Citrobacter sp. wls619]|uniref:hypothetical protein n=1 Tax=Citrobacter sp. wls619 TaxID=2576432 RepID=UPI0010C9F831|nr:hypothetical protein [Citrobacter sp. wls619]TKV08242.1 hypothetical protein FDX19_15505 [Citrobacter sp. wls619]
MKELLKKAKKWFSACNELAAANSYIAYLQGEVKAYRDIADVVVREAAKKDVEMLSMSHELSAAHDKVASAKERYFVKVCKHIYSNGKMISEMRFRGMVGAMIGEGTHNAHCLGVSANYGVKISEQKKDSKSKGK